MKNTQKQNSKPRYEVISYGGKYQVEPSLDLYEVKDFMGEKRYGLAICLNVVENNKVVEPFATFTVSFGSSARLSGVDLAHARANRIRW